LLRWLQTMPPLTMKQTLSFLLWRGDVSRFGMCVITIKNNVKVQICIRTWYIHAFVILFSLSIFVRHDYLLCIVTLTKRYSSYHSLGSLNLLATSMMHCVWLGGKILPPKSNMFPSWREINHVTNPTTRVLGLNKEAWVASTYYMKK
jgi:hypothetical protein